MLFVLDLATGAWNQRRLRGPVPSPRTSFALALVPARGNGGATPGQAQEQAAGRAAGRAAAPSLSSFTSSSSPFFSSSSSASSSSRAAAWPSGGVVVSGGAGVGYRLLGDAHVLDLDTLTWAPLLPTPEPHPELRPDPRAMQAQRLPMHGQSTEPRSKQADAAADVTLLPLVQFPQSDQRTPLSSPPLFPPLSPMPISTQSSAVLATASGALPVECTSGEALSCACSSA